MPYDGRLRKAEWGYVSQLRADAGRQTGADLRFEFCYTDSGAAE
ncbi:hypothetical protein DSM19430T_03900 [Desulfovibrio psychrotolerans]|uniref:Uncharacterized protein n=1 Tax=Desulfovibrio psychrotolerans TaxID=415242 RepID=A0A7J0BPS6_9BACT|nr:hypothetical protein DSM19430T_03900 [Desulfovibrio psychrotolerans]